MLRTQKYTIQTRKLTAPVTIAHLSDLHGFSQSPTAGAILRAIRSENPDIVAMTGDMVDSRTADTEPFLSLCRELARGYLSYYIPGNHEQALGKVRFSRLLRDIDSTGVSVLNNRRQYLSVRGQNMAIYGLTTPLSSYKSILAEQLFHLQLTESDLTKALGPCPERPFTLLLYHNPQRFPVCAGWGADLTLSGHIHGGIVKLPVFGGLLSPAVTFFPVYDGGHFETAGRHLVVSRGLGNNFARRFNNPPELSFITLTPYKSNSES